MKNIPNEDRIFINVSKVVVNEQNPDLKFIIFYKPVYSKGSPNGKIFTVGKLNDFFFNFKP